MPLGTGNHNEEKKIVFSAQDNLSPFMKKVQGDQKKLYDEMAVRAKKFTDSEKEQLKLIEAQIKALERKSRLQKEMARDQLRSLREGSQGDPFKEVRADEFAKQIHTATLADKMKFAGLRENLTLDKLNRSGSAQQQEEDKTTQSVFTGSLAANLVAELMKGVAQSVRKFATAETGIEAIPSVFGIGDAFKRRLILQNEFDTARFGYKALTGGSARVPSMTRLGFDQVATSEAMTRIAQARGGNGADVKNVLGLQRGYSIGEGTILGALGTERMGVSSGMTNIQRGLGIAMAEGLNRSRFADVLTNQTTLLQEFAKTATVPDSDQANKTLFEFNKVGGQFAIGDPRAMGNIMSINNALAHPSDPVGQAMNYMTLRKLNPGADPWKLQMMQQQGLQTPGFLEAVMNDTMKMSGNQTYNKFMLAERLGLGNNFAAVDRILENRGKIGSMSQSDISKMLSDSAISKEAGDLTSKKMRYPAEVSDAFREGMIDGVGKVAEQFVEEMKKAVTDIVEDIKDKARTIYWPWGGTYTFGGKEVDKSGKKK